MDAVYEPGTAFAAAVDAVRRGEWTVDDAAVGLVSRLTDPELLGLLDGDVDVLTGLRTMATRHNAEPVQAGRVDRLGIPGIRFTDGPRGVVMGASTAFPAAIARAASWDTDLERRVGDAIGAEARAQGANLFAGVCINLAPAPGWGRSQESYGEDPLLLGAFGAALVAGVQPWVLACVKHFALNSMEEARFRVDVQVDENVLHEVYLPHFRAVVEAGVDAVMSAYNSVNGTWAGENRHLLTEILRGQWGFEGFVMTDFIWGLRHPVESVAAGQDLEMPFRQQRAAALPPALADGRLARADVQRAATRLVSAQLRLALRARPTPPTTVVACAKHRTLAREAARLGAVLLRNEPVAGVPVLPLTLGRADPLAVVGRLADAPNLGDVGSSQVHPPDTCSVLQGLRERLPGRVRTADGRDVAAAVRAARAAAAAVVVVGLTSRDEGEALMALDPEAVQVLGGVARWRPLAAAIGTAFGVVARRKGMGGDRRDLHLHPDDVRLVEAVAAANPRTVVVVVGGGTVMPDPWDTQVPAVLLAWYPGQAGGAAIADVLLGDAEPGGRLPVAIPRRRADLPVVDWTARRVRYGRWWGQRRLDRDGAPAAYAFGFGLGYTEFRLEAIAVGSVEGERFPVTVTVTNTGARRGRHVVQVYATRVPDPVEDRSAGADGSGTDQPGEVRSGVAWPGEERPVPVLVGFRPVTADPGESVAVPITCSLRPLQRWTADGFVLPAGPILVAGASWSGDPAAVTAPLAP